MPTLSDQTPTVSFLIGGVQKAGTTALYSMLDQHPKLCLPVVKELHFFDNEEHFEADTLNYKQYHNHFKNKQPTQLCGEATPSYIYVKPAIQRVYEYNPKMKWIILLRHPVDRAYSHWNMQRQRRWEDLSFKEAIEAEENRLLTMPEHIGKRFAYTARSRYASQIDNLLTYFERSQCIFITSEALLEDSLATLGSITEFLGVPKLPFEGVRNHVGEYKEKLSGNLHIELTKLFLDDIRATENLTSINLAGWIN